MSEHVRKAIETQLQGIAERDAVDPHLRAWTADVLLAAVHKRAAQKLFGTLTTRQQIEAIIDGATHCGTRELGQDHFAAAIGAALRSIGLDARVRVVSLGDCTSIELQVDELVVDCSCCIVRRASD